VNELYKERYTSLFGDKPIVRGSWIFDRDQMRLVPRDEYVNPHSGNDAHSILKPLDPFVSPIDGSLIDDRSKLRKHNKEHGVTNVADYGSGYFERRGKEKYADSIGATKEAKRERVAALQETMHKFGLH
jgi:hypothetical protein